MKNWWFGFMVVLSVRVSAQSMQDGLKDMESERYIKAKSTFSQLILKDPKNSLPYYYLGEIYLNTNHPDSARYYYSRGIQTDPNGPMNYVGLGKLILPKDYIEGRKNFDKAISLSPKEPEIYAAIGGFFINSEARDLNQALVFLDKGFKHSNTDAGLYLVYGDMYQAQNDGNKAIINYEKAMDLDKKNPETYLKTGKLYSRAKNYDLGLDFYKKGLAADSNYAPLYREISELYYKAKQYEKAITAYKKYLDKTDKNDENNFRYASFLFLNKDYDNTITILDKLIEKGKPNPIAYRLMAYSCFEKQAYSKGIENFDQFWKNAESTKIIPSDYEYYGKLLARTGKDSLAIYNLNKAIALDSSRSEIYTELGSIYYNLKNYEASGKAYEKKCLKKGVTGQDLLNYGRALYFNKEYPKADSVFTILTEVKPTYAPGYLWRGRVNANIDPESVNGLAKPYYEKFIELCKGDTEKNKKDLIEAYSYLGYFYLLKKSNPEAKSAWQMVKSLDPANKKAMDALKVLK
jgi:tetratricopeptide (TPR) repeat protein